MLSCSALKESAKESSVLLRFPASYGDLVFNDPNILETAENALIIYLATQLPNDMDIYKVSLSLSPLFNDQRSFRDFLGDNGIFYYQVVRIDSGQAVPVFPLEKGTYT